jgi:hypothetical protein
MKRLLSHKITIDPGSGYPPVDLDLLWHVSVDYRRGLRDLLKDALGLDIDGCTKERELITAARRIAFRCGVPIFVIDESQFLTYSSAANAKITQLLYSLRFFGVPLFFVANFSLCARLKRRPLEDQHRLLSAPAVVVREDPADPSIQELYEEYSAVSGGVLLSEPAKHEEQIHIYTLGLNRYRVHLLALAYRTMRERGDHLEKVESQDLETAYRSAEYANFREEVQLLYSQDVTGQEAHKDLWCPFPLPPSTQALVAQRHKEKEQEAVLQQAAASSMNPEGRAAFERLKDAGAEPDPPSVRSRRPPPTREALLKGAALARARNRA